jgi:hypothetical protein
MPVADAASAYRSSPDGGRFSEQDLLEGQELLVSAGMVELEGSSLKLSAAVGTLTRMDEDTARVALLARSLVRTPPLWLRAAAGGSEVRYALIPDDSRAELEALLASRRLMDALLRSAARSVHEVRVRGSGARARSVVVRECREQLESSGEPGLAGAVRGVGELAESLGYDLLAPALAGVTRRLVVRVAKKPGWCVEVSLTRTELEVGLADPDWALIVCELGSDGAVRIVGWCRAAQLEALIPADVHPHGRWTRVSLLVMATVLMPGLPPV